MECKITKYNFPLSSIFFYNTHPFFLLSISPEKETSYKENQEAPFPIKACFFAANLNEQ